MLLRPLSLAFQIAARARQFAYQKYSSPEKFPVKIISVGNVTVGGTGKTPFVDFLCKQIKNRKVAILSRGYKRLSRGFLKVNTTQQNAAELYGDEPLMLALKNPNVTVFVCENRVEGVGKILKAQDVDVVILDDALQNFSIQKDLEFVILDATEKLENYKFLPEGRARTALTAIDLNKIIVFTKTDLASEQTLFALEKKFEAHKRLKMVYSRPHLHHFKTGQDLKHAESVFLLSGIGKPQNFEKLVAQTFSFKIQKHFSFSDHYRYSQKTLDVVAKEVGSQPLLVTEKDYAKLQFLTHNLNLYVVGAEFQIIEGSELLEDVLKLEAVKV